MKDEGLLRMWISGAGRHYEIPLLDTLRTIARAAASGQGGGGEQNVRHLHQAWCARDSECVHVERFRPIQHDRQ